MKNKVYSFSVIALCCVAIGLLIPVYQRYSHDSFATVVNRQEKVDQLVQWTLSGCAYRVQACVDDFSNAQKRLLIKNLNTRLSWFYSNYGGENQIKHLISQQEQREFWGSAVAFAGTVGAALLGSYASDNNAPASSVAAVGGLGAGFVAANIADKAGQSASDIKYILAHVQAVQYVLSAVETSYRPTWFEKSYCYAVNSVAKLLPKKAPKEIFCSVSVASIKNGKKNAVAKSIRKLNSELSSKQARELVENIPSVIQEKVSEKDAYTAKKLLEKVGATVTITEV